MCNLQTPFTVSIDAFQHHIRQLPGSTFCCLCIRAAPTPSDTIRRSSCNHFTYLGNLVVTTQGPTASLLETWLAAFAAIPQTHWIPACLCRSRLAVLLFSFVHFSLFTLFKSICITNFAIMATVNIRRVIIILSVGIIYSSNPCVRKFPIPSIVIRWNASSQK